MSTVICGAMTSMNEHSEEDNLKDHSIEDILVRAEVMLNDTFQHRKLMGLSNTCKAALKDQRKSNMRKSCRPHGRGGVCMHKDHNGIP